LLFSRYRNFDNITISFFSNLLLFSELPSISSNMHYAECAGYYTAYSPHPSKQARQSAHVIQDFWTQPNFRLFCRVNELNLSLWTNIAVTYKKISNINIRSIGNPPS